MKKKKTHKKISTVQNLIKSDVIPQKNNIYLYAAFSHH